MVVKWSVGSVTLDVEPVAVSGGEMKNWPTESVEDGVKYLKKDNLTSKSLHRGN